MSDVVKHIKASIAVSYNGGTTTKLSPKTYGHVSPPGTYVAVTGLLLATNANLSIRYTGVNFT